MIARLGILLAAFLTLVPPVALAAPARAPQAGAAAFKAVSFADLPQPAYVEVHLADDDPDNVRLAWAVHEGLQRRGLLADNGPTLVLSLQTETVGVPDEPARGDAAGGLLVLGVLRATLTDGRSGQRLWEGEGVYRMRDGDLPAGALALAPVLVDALGQSVAYDRIRLP